MKNPKTGQYDEAYPQPWGCIHHDAHLADYIFSGKAWPLTVAGFAPVTEDNSLLENNPEDIGPCR